jgi:hypothetical protein
MRALMKLGLGDLHASVGDALKARLWHLRLGHDVQPEDAAARRLLASGWKGRAWKVLAAIPVGGLLGAGIAAAFGASGGGMAGVTFMGAYLSGIGVGVGSILLQRFARNPAVDAEELRALASGLELGVPETIYLHTLCALMESGDAISEQTGNEILAALNELLEQARYVDGQLERLRTATGTESMRDLEEERELLAGRMAQMHDPRARDYLSQSLGMCDERLRDARTIAPLIEQLDAQREVIHQTLLSVQSSVSRLQVAPSALSAPGVEEVKRVMSQVIAQTHAVEEAVQEVMSVHS